MAQVARRLHLVDAAPMTHFAGFEPWLRANNCGNNTIEDRLNHLADFAGAHPGFPNVTPSQVTNWLGRPGYAQWTRATYFGHLRSYFAFAVDVGFVQVDPMARSAAPQGWEVRAATADTRPGRCGPWLGRRTRTCTPG